MEQQTLFSIPMFIFDFESHEKNQKLYKTYIDEYLDNKATIIDTSKISKSTSKNLHSVSIFDDLVYFLSNLSPTFHKSFSIPTDRTIALTSMWATKCKKNEYIADQYQISNFLYGVYFLDTPPGSGKMNISLDLADRNYYNELPPENFNTVNTNNFSCQTPTGKILIIPSHLTTSFDFNIVNDPRYMIHFCLKVIY